MPDNPKCIFRTRLIDAMKKQNMSIVQLADKIHVSEDTIKKYRRKDSGNLPSLDTIKRLANALNVDTAYLLGEIDCERIESQQVHELTGLSKTASEKFKNMDNEDIEMLSILLENDRFSELLSNCRGFIYSHFSNSIIISSPFSNDFRCSENQNSKILKYSASDCFNLILEDVFQSRKEQAKAEYELALSLELIDIVQEYIKGNDINKYEDLFKMRFEKKQKEIKNINPNSQYAQMDFETMLKLETVNPTDVNSLIPGTKVSVTSNVPNGILTELF